jgi:hypothetical protein
MTAISAVQQRIHLHFWANIRWWAPKVAQVWGGRHTQDRALRPGSLLAICRCV